MSQPYEVAISLGIDCAENIDEAITQFRVMVANSEDLIFVLRDNTTGKCFEVDCSDDDEDGSYSKEEIKEYRI